MGALVGIGAPDLKTLQNFAAVPTLIRASKTFTGAANLGATGVNELFTTTGAVMVDGFWVRCTSDLEDTVDGAEFNIGVTGSNAICYTGVGIDLDTIDAGDGFLADSIVDGWANSLISTGPVAIIDNFIMTISTQAITGGVLVFYVLYRPLSADGALSLGAGMVAV